MIRKLAFDPVSIAAGAAIAAGSSFVAKNAVTAAADAVDTKGKNLSKYELKRKSKTGKVVARAKQVAGKAVHNFKTKAFQTGLLHGIDPERTHESAVWYWVESTPYVGSEHPTFHYNLGYKLGERMKYLPHEEKQQKLRELRKNIMELPDYRSFPHMGAVVDGIDRTISNKKNTFTSAARKHGIKNKKVLGSKLMKLQPGGFTKTLEEQKRRQEERRFIPPSDKERKQRKRALRSYQVARFAGKWIDPDRAVKAGLEKWTTVPEKIKAHLVRKAFKKLGPTHKETIGEKASNVAGRVFINPRVRDVGEGARAFRNAMFADKKRTLNAGNKILKNVTNVDAAQIFDALHRKHSNGTNNNN